MIPLYEAGFDTETIETLDVRHLSYLKKEIRAREEIKRLKFLIDLADAVRLGAAAVHIKNFNPKFDRWKKSVERAIERIEGTDRPKPSIWEKLKKSAKLN